MAQVLNAAGGLVCNFRGDGLFGVFGIDNEGNNPPDLDKTGGKFAQDAVTCGIAMLETIEKAINPIFSENDLPSDLQIGVGIDSGRVVITRIGLESINELTVYGAPVNSAAKLCGGNGNLRISDNIDQVFPRVKGGKVNFKPFHHAKGAVAGTPPDGHQLVQPTPYTALH